MSNSPFFGPMPEGVDLGQAENSGFMSMLQEQIVPNFAPGYVMVELEDKGLTRTSETVWPNEFGLPLGWRFLRILQEDEGSSNQARCSSVHLLLKH